MEKTGIEAAPGTKRPRIARRMAVMVGLFVVLFGLVVGYHLLGNYMMKKGMAAGGIPPATVSTMKAEFTDWQNELEAVGSLRALRGVDISTEIAGLVRSVNFRSGQDVAAGEVLVELNGDAERAQLESMQAAAELAQTTLARDREQFAVQAVSQATIDADQADLKGKTAQVAQLKAALAKKTILAPFAGRVGITTVNPGQYLNAGDKIVTLQTIDPVLIDFYVPQREIARMALGQAVDVTADGWPQRTFPGRVTAINATVDPATRNIQVEATVRNPKRELLPGMFVRASVSLGGKQHLITLPQAAIAYNPYGATVFIAKSSKDAKGAPVEVAQQVFVTPGPTRGDQVGILKGVDESAVVVTSGQLKLRNGTPLIVNNATSPLNDPNPTPQEH